MLRTVFSFPVFLGAVLAAITFYFANRGVADPDIWWHLRNAEILLKTHHFIRADMYSYTVPGVPWINHEWLGEVPYYLAWRALGLRGLFLLMIALLEIILLGTYYLSSVVSGNAKAAFVGTWLAAFLATISFGPRTLLFGWTYLIALILILWRYKEQGRDALWLLPPLFCLWVNSHGSWLIGMAVLWIFILTGLVELAGPFIESTRWNRVQLRRLLTVGAVSVAALFVNPYGSKLVFYPFDLALRQTLNVSNVEEWASPDFHGLRGKILLGSILLVLGFSVFRKQRWRLEWFALFLLGVYASVTYVRFMFLAAIIFTPILATRLDMIPPYEKEKDKPLLNAVLIAAAVVFSAWRFPAEKALQTDVDGIYAAQALPHLQQRVRENPGRVLNAYLWGGYMIFYSRDVPVFIDSRVDIYEYHGVLKEYLDFTNLQNSLELLEKYQIRYVFLQTHSAQAYFFDHLPTWHATYRDDVATMYERTPK
ncbi:MAG TPA: hypothetical protein VKW06_08065 [Candidatus Angelobacter sp.]|nr:hypothetical protein [Candidatus Angelobacter sp.]